MRNQKLTKEQIVCRFNEDFDAIHDTAHIIQKRFGNMNDLAFKLCAKSVHELAAANIYNLALLVGNFIRITKSVTPDILASAFPNLEWKRLKKIAKMANRVGFKSLEDSNVFFSNPNNSSDLWDIIKNDVPVLEQMTARLAEDAQTGPENFLAPK